MPIYWVVLLLVMISTGLIGMTEKHAETQAANVDVTSIAHSLIIYRSAVAEYAHQHPEAVGFPSDTLLQLPTWYVRLPGISAYVSSGLSYTYYPSPPNGLLHQLIELTGSSLAIGYAQDGQIISPSAGSIGVTVPAAIPTGSAIAFQ